MYEPTTSCTAPMPWTATAIEVLVWLQGIRVLPGVPGCD
jgi:hypothetical protein